MGKNLPTTRRAANDKKHVGEFHPGTGRFQLPHSATQENTRFTNPGGKGRRPLTSG